MVTSRIQDVARAAGVSTATVSRALRGLPRVSSATRARVLQAAAELHYVASPNAASLASGKTHVVGVVVPYVTRWYFAELISGATQVLRDYGFHVLLLDVGDEGPDRNMHLDRKMIDKRVDALAILSLRLHESERELLRRLEIPVVTVGVPDQGWPCVRIDDHRTTQLASQHLIDLGHCEIAYIGAGLPHMRKFRTPADRLAGFQECLSAHGLRADHTWAADWTPAAGYRAATELLSSGQRPTGIVCASDELAFGAIRAAQDLGLDLPGELAITGVDNHFMAELFGLTTVSQSPSAQGGLATSALLAQLQGQEFGSQIIEAPIELITRSSSAPP